MLGSLELLFFVPLKKQPRDVAQVVVFAWYAQCPALNPQSCIKWVS